MKRKCSKKGCYEPADCNHGRCRNHCSEDHPLLQYSSRSRPRTNVPHLGVEIEVEFPTTADRDRALPLRGHYDGSLATNCSAEFKICKPSDQAGKAAAKLVHELWLRRGKATKSCGLHVHIDVRGIPVSRLLQLFDWLSYTESVWFSLVPPSRRENQYVVRLPSPPTTGRIPSDHYQWVHRSPFSTVEIRIHGGTVNPYKIRGWIDAMRLLQERINDLAYEFRGQPYTPEEAFFHVFPAGTEGREYLDARRAGNGILQDRAYQPREEVA